MIVFSVQVIYTCANVIDKNHAFCKSNFFTLLIAGFLSPLFGLSNDWLGARVNSVIIMGALATLSLYSAKFVDKTELNKFSYLLASHILINW